MTPINSKSGVIELRAMIDGAVKSWQGRQRTNALKACQWEMRKRHGLANIPTVEPSKNDNLPTGFEKGKP